MATTNFQAFMDNQLRMMGAMPTLAGSKQSQASAPLWTSTTTYDPISPTAGVQPQLSNQTSTQPYLPMTSRIGDERMFGAFTDFLNKGANLKDLARREEGRQFDANLSAKSRFERDSANLARLQANRDWLSGMADRNSTARQQRMELRQKEKENNRAYNLARTELFTNRSAAHADRAAAQTNDILNRRRQSRMDFELAQERNRERSQQMAMFNRNLLETEKDRELQRYLAGVELEKSRYNTDAARENAALDFAGNVFGGLIGRGNGLSHLGFAYGA